MKIKILTFNIHKGFNWNNTKITIELLKENLLKEKPDIVFLQEVSGQNIKLAKKFDHYIDNQFEYLTDELWHEGVFSNHAIYDHRNHGNVILSKFPIKEHEVINISQNNLEQRSLLYAELMINDKPVHTFCTHLNLLHRDRVRQYRLIKEYILDKSGEIEQIILAGDFNDWNQHASKHFMDIPEMSDGHHDLHGSYPKTFPSLLPFFKLDRIYTRGFNILTAEVLKDKKWTFISDHLPISLEVQVK